MAVTSPDLSSLVPDWSAVTTGVLAVAVSVAGVWVAWKGCDIMLRWVKGTEWEHNDPDGFGDD